MKLREIAHARAGDKGNTSNIAVFVYRAEQYQSLVEWLTPDVVAAHFRGIVHGKVIRYELPRLNGLNFVLHDALAGGVTRSLSLDAHGKCFSSIFLDLEVPKGVTVPGD
jgi:hypothetical protein